MPLLSVRHSVFGLSVCKSGCNHILKVCGHDVLQSTYGNFTKFTTWVQLGTKLNWLDFEKPLGTVLRLEGEGDDTGKKLDLHLNYLPWYLSLPTSLHWKSKSRSRSRWDQMWSKITCSKIHLSSEGKLVDGLPSKTIDRVPTGLPKQNSLTFLVNHTFPWPISA